MITNNAMAKAVPRSKRAVRRGELLARGVAALWSLQPQTAGGLWRQDGPLFLRAHDPRHGAVYLDRRF